MKKYKISFSNILNNLTRNKSIRKFVLFLKRCNNHDIIGMSAKTAYYLLLSFFPLMLLLLSLAAKNDIQIFNYIMPPSVIAILEDIVDSTPAIGKMTILSLVLLLWSASTSIRALMRGIYIAHTGLLQERVKKSRLWALIFTIFLIVGVFICVSLTFLSHFDVNGLCQRFASLNRYILYTVQIITMTILIFIFTLSLYKMTPGDKMKTRNIYKGAILVSVCWIAITWCFEMYMKMFNKYSLLYGTIGAFLGLALWLYIISIVLFIGAEINGYLYKQRNNKA